jgi:DAPG hydrolase PhiG domain
MTSTKWKLLPPRPFNWTMKPLACAETGVKRLDDGRLELRIRHDILKGVTPAMIDWWFQNIAGTMEHMGQTYPRYLVWHPIDHIHFELTRRAPDGSGGLGAQFHIVEALGANLDYLVDSLADVLKADDTGHILSVRHSRVEAIHIEHTYTPVPGGTLFQSRTQVVPKAVPEAMGRAWLKHSVEEIGNLEFFLPALYASQVVQGAGR